MSKVFIAHPVLQHSHQLALALYEDGKLLSFWSGTPICQEKSEVPWYIPESYSKKIKQVGIPKRYRKSILCSQILLKSGRLFSFITPKSDYQHRIFHLFDYLISKKIANLQPDVVICYENSAYHTFSIAKKLGIKCILDAPSLHHLSGASLMPVASTPYLPEINRRKDEEVELADLIICCSPLAAKSYIDNGVAPDKVKPVLLGADLPNFSVRENRHDKPLSFVFAGVLSHRKSIDLIISVFERLADEGFSFRLNFVGGCDDSSYIKSIDSMPGANYIKSLPQPDLYKIFNEADCLLLPSRFDSFGMVVAEAMACGIPAIVSTQTGSKAMIEMYPEAGWIVEPSENSIYQCVKDLIENREKVFSAKEKAVEAATTFTWPAYRARVQTVIRDFINKVSQC